MLLRLAFELKREATCRLMIEPNLHRKIKNFWNSARSSILPCSLGLTGRDLQGGTEMEALCKFLSFNLSKLVNISLLSFIKKKIKIVKLV